MCYSSALRPADSVPSSWFFPAVASELRGASAEAQVWCFEAAQKLNNTRAGLLRIMSAEPLCNP